VLSIPRVLGGQVSRKARTATALLMFLIIFLIITIIIINSSFCLVASLGKSN
jgi:hypothetical protein